MKINDRNRISVIIPNYNHERFLRSRIESVLIQSYKDFECLLFDDASTDGSETIIKELLPTDERVTYYPAIKNSKSTFRQWNKGVKNAEGQVVWIAESDDNADPDFLKKASVPFSGDPEIVLVYCQSYRFNENNEITGTWKDYTDNLDKELFAKDFIMDGREYINRFLIHRNTIPNASAVLFRKDIYEKVGGAPEHLKTNGDWLTWLKMLCYGKVSFIAKPMNYFRYHDNSVIAKANRLKKEEQYNEQYDYTMRKEFKQFIEQYHIDLPTAAKKANEYFIALDKGNEGLFKLQNGQIVNGWREIIRASIYPRLQSGFIKKAFKG